MMTNHSSAGGCRSTIQGKWGGDTTLLLHYRCGNSGRRPIRAGLEESGRFVYVDVFKASTAHSDFGPTVAFLRHKYGGKGARKLFNFRRNNND